MPLSKCGNQCQHIHRLGINKMLYLAYGANLNKRNMAMRCPLATPLCSINLKGYKLAFNNVATIVKSADDSVPIGVWRITDKCEKALDKYEGFPNLYRKEYFDLTKIGLNQGMVYIMNYAGQAVPNKIYFDTIKQGYQDFQMEVNCSLRPAKSPAQSGFFYR